MSRDRVRWAAYMRGYMASHPEARRQNTRRGLRRRELNPEERKKHDAVYRDRHRGKVRAAQRKWSLEHPEYRQRPDQKAKVIARVRRWQKANPEKLKALRSTPKALAALRVQTRRWYWANLEKARAQHRIRAKRYAVSGRAKERARERYHENLERSRFLSRAKMANRKAKLRNAPGTHTRDELLALFARYEGRCAYCGAPATSADHVVALAAGGSNGIENLVPACAFCNSSKRDRPLAEFLARRAASAVQPRNP